MCGGPGVSGGQSEGETTTISSKQGMHQRFNDEVDDDEH